MLMILTQSFRYYCCEKAETSQGQPLDLVAGSIEPHGQGVKPIFTTFVGAPQRPICSNGAAPSTYKQNGGAESSGGGTTY
jgi:hypothetical protein